MKPMTTNLKASAVALLSALLGLLAFAAPNAAAGPGKCFGKQPTITKADADAKHRLIGTDGNDVIVAPSYKFIVRAEDGNDLVCAPRGRSTSPPGPAAIGC